MHVPSVHPWLEIVQGRRENSCWIHRDEKIERFWSPYLSAKQRLIGRKRPETRGEKIFKETRVPLRKGRKWKRELEKYSEEKVFSQQFSSMWERENDFGKSSLRSTHSKGKTTISGTRAKRGDGPTGQGTWIEKREEGWSSTDQWNPERNSVLIYGTSFFAGQHDQFIHWA